MDIRKPILPNYDSNTSVTSSSNPSMEASRAKETLLKPSLVAQDTPQLTLQEGQIIHGEIIDLRYHHITIRLEPGNQTVNAKVEGNLPLAIGQTAQFQVVHGTSEHLLLKYIPSSLQTTAEAMIAKALTASNLPLTSQNKSLVALLLNHNMSIDIKSLRTMVNLVKRYPDANPRTLILMHKYRIPITKENIAQFESYANQTQQFSSMIHELSNTIKELLQISENSAYTGIAQQQNTPESTANNDSIKDPSYAAEHVTNNDGANHTEGNLKLLSAIHSNLLDMLDDNQNGKPSEGLPEVPGNIQSGTEHTTPLQSNEPNILPNTAGAQANAAIDSPKTPHMESSFNLLNNEVTIMHTDRALQTILNEQEISKLMKHLEIFPDAQPLCNQIANRTVTISEIFNFAKSHSIAGNLALTKHLLQSPEYSKPLTEALRNKWRITPQKLKEPDSLKQFYETIDKDMDRLSKLIENSNRTLETMRMLEPAKNLQENLSFLKDLNQVFTYLPIPLQLKNQNTHCDLYVLSRKKALKHPKEGLTVLLSLTMEYLGPINIHIHMVNNQIHAKFHLEDSSGGQLIAEHMDTLTDALREKGYNLHAEVLDTYKKTDFIEDFIEPDALETDIQRYTFDIRT